jgi:alanine-glyoxylate transaminase/serine-glyoxylate transaminase/serine-pyruvate transaminase
MQAHKTANMRTAYWDWTSRNSPLHYMKHCGTPPEHLMFGLRAALDMIFEEGLEAVLHRHALLAGATHAAIARWAEGQVLSFNIEDAKERAVSVTPVLVAGNQAEVIGNFTKRVCGVTLGLGIGDLSGKAFRIAHMGHSNAAMVLGTLSAVEMALQSLGIPHGAGGTSAAIAYLGRLATLTTQTSA